MIGCQFPTAPTSRAAVFIKSAEGHRKWIGKARLRNSSFPVEPFAFYHSSESLGV